MSPEMSPIDTVARSHVRDTLAIAMNHTDAHAAVIVADERTELSRILVRAYRACLPNARFVPYDEITPDEVKASFGDLVGGDLVVLIQSTIFRIEDFRIRVELFKRDIKVVEHSNLNRMEGEAVATYISALAYDPAYYRGVGHSLKARMDVARSARIESEGESLAFTTPFESAKLNIGDFEGLKNVGSGFPIGEVFTEARDLEQVNGRVKIYGFTDLSIHLNVPSAPITLVVERGRVVRTENSTPDFDAVLEAIRAHEGDVWIRELGFGMNRGFSRERRVPDVGAFERVCGVHLSLGAKHGVYKKPHLKPREARFHVDTFVVTDRVLLDDDVVFADGAWTT